MNSLVLPVAQSTVSQTTSPLINSYPTWDAATPDRLLVIECPPNETASQSIYHNSRHACMCDRRHSKGGSSRNQSIMLKHACREWERAMTTLLPMDPDWEDTCMGHIYLYRSRGCTTYVMPSYLERGRHWAIPGYISWNRDRQIWLNVEELGYWLIRNNQWIAICMETGLIRDKTKAGGWIWNIARKYGSPTLNVM